MVSKAAPALAGGNRRRRQSRPRHAVHGAIPREALGRGQAAGRRLQRSDGAGSRVGEALCLHPDVAGITLTGSTEVGLQSRIAGGSREQANHARARRQITRYSCFTTRTSNGLSPVRALRSLRAGRDLSAGSRLIVQSDVHDVVVDGVRAYAEALKIGDPLDPETQMGSLISEAHLQRILKTVRDGLLMEHPRLGGAVSLADSL